MGLLRGSRLVRARDDVARGGMGGQLGPGLDLDMTKTLAPVLVTATDSGDETDGLTDALFGSKLKDYPGLPIPLYGTKGLGHIPDGELTTYEVQMVPSPGLSVSVEWPN